MAHIWLVEIHNDSWQIYGKRTTEEDAKVLANTLFDKGFKRVRYRKGKNEKATERFSARWLFHEDDSGEWWDKCSICGGKIPNNNGACCGFPFCPMCGAEMVMEE